MTAAVCAHSHAGFGNNQTASVEDAERRLARGEKQRRCPVCKLWIWESMFFGAKP